MPPDITELVFLRYLALASSSMLLNHIPLCKNWNLQTLIISEDDNVAHELPHGIQDKHQPHGIWGSHLQQHHGIQGLQQLRHLEIYHQVSIDLLNDDRENLQTLYWLSISQCTEKVFWRIRNVKELGIVAEGSQVSPQGLKYLYDLYYLEKLRIQGSDHPLHLPPNFKYLRYLKELTFVRTHIPWKDINIIGDLDYLEVLKLKNFACTGQEWRVTNDFPQLKVLIISHTDLKEWKAWVDSPFPQLECLLLKKCFELTEMPDWIADSITLQLIKLVHCYDSLVRSANQIKDDQLNYYGNDMLDVLDFHTRPDHYHVDPPRRRRFKWINLWRSKES